MGVTLTGSTLEQKVNTWFRWAGFTFDPFIHLEASGDPRLSEYLVGHDAFTRVWGNHIAWVFAPAGGGKTALRIAVARACWVGQETNRPFPLSYVPPFLEWGHTHPSLDEHLTAIAQAGATTLLLALAYRPHWLLRLKQHERQRVLQTLTWNLPSPLGTYLEHCARTKSPEMLRKILDPAFPLRDTPRWEIFQEWLDVMQMDIKRSPPPSPSARWGALKDVLQNVLGFPAIYILADGFDAAPETAFAADTLVQSLAPLLEHLEAWAGERVYFKGFLPQETQDFLRSRFPALARNEQVARIRWTPDLLAEVIRRRVYVATEGTFSSLDAVASAEVRDVELTLAKEIVPLPREILVITRRLIKEHVARAGGEGLLTEEDLKAVISWYKREGKLTIGITRG